MKESITRIGGGEVEGVADNVRKVFSVEGRDVHQARVTTRNGESISDVCFFLLCGSFAVTEQGHQHSSKYLRLVLPNGKSFKFKV